MKVCSHCRRCHDDSVSSCTEGHPPLSEHRTGSCELIPGYRLEQQLESGLKGETYLAREKVSGRTCLIRLLPPNEASREQFLYEAGLAATLFHPNVADVYEADSLTSGELYVVAEVPEGQTARELLKTTGTPPLLNALRFTFV
jgi:serine/threonine protein kinase